MSLYTEGLALALSPEVLLFILLGTILGMVTGALPGLSAMMAVSILVPLTYGLSPAAGILMLIGVYCSANYAGSISATLVNIPGTPSAVMTTLDAYPMAKRGEAGRAIAISTISSALAGLASVFVLAAVAPFIAGFALEFTTVEMLAVAIFGISIVAFISEGSTLKGLISGVLGLLIATVGSDPVTSTPRFTFGEVGLISGVQFIAVMIGLFGVTEVLLNVENYFKNQDVKVEKAEFKVNKWLPWLDVLKDWANFIRSTVIGIFIGAAPGAGGTIASIIAYATQKKMSKKPDEMGKGSVEGIVAAESANNSCTGGAMITLLSLGVPGDSVTAILIGAFMIHGLVPGPMLFETNMELVSAIFIGMVVANALILLVGLGTARYFAKLLLIPKPVFNASVLALCFVGTFANENNFFDIQIMLVFAVIGYAMSKLGLPKAPLVLALILGPLLEQNLRRFLSMGEGNFWNYLTQTMMTHPIAVTLFLLTAITLVVPLFKKPKIFTGK